MTKVRVLVQFRTFRVQKWVFDEISRWCCRVLPGEAQKTFFLIKNLKNTSEVQKIIQKSMKIRVFLGFPVALWPCLWKSPIKLPLELPVETVLCWCYTRGATRWICVGLETVFFLASPRKTMQNHLEISSKTQLGTRNVRNWTNTMTLDMSGPAKTCPGGQVLTANQRNTFIFQKLHLSAFTKKYYCFWSKNIFQFLQEKTCIII